MDALPLRLPIVGREEVFDGNDDPGSIGCNLGSAHPGLERFRRVLADVKTRPEVQDVLVAIWDVPEDGWPFSETICVLTSADPATVAYWLSELSPDRVSDALETGAPVGMPELRPGMAAMLAWWD